MVSPMQLCLCSGGPREVLAYLWALKYVFAIRYNVVVDDMQIESGSM